MTRRFAAILVAALLAAPVISQAELAPVYHEWAAGPVHFLFTPADREAWQQVATDAEAEGFIRLFWARRDPTPETPDNEFQAEFERRAAFADQRFPEKDRTGAEVRGSLSDRGHVFLIFGPPRRVQEPGAGGTTTGGDFGVGGNDAGGGGAVASGGGPGVFGRGGSTERFGPASEERWLYEDEHRPDFVKKKRLTVRFRTEPGSDEVQLFQAEEVLGYLAEGAEVAVVNPDLTLADLATAAAPAAAPGTGGDFSTWGAEPLAEGDAELAKLRSAMGGDGGHRIDAHLDSGAYQASDGTWIVPFQVSTRGGQEASAVIGELVDAEGASRIAFKVAPPWKTSNDQRLLKATLVTPPGSYELHTGVESPSGDVVWTGSEPVEVPAATGDFWISEVVLSEHIFPMQQAQQMLEPYAWQGIVVVPKGDHTFAQGDLLWYYLHACNPQLGDDGKPNLRLSIQFSGAAELRGPVGVDPVKAGDNCWVLAQGMDLEADRFPAGDYELKVNVRDSTGKKTLVSDPVALTVVAAGG
jgi:GWxTD domain-containing protein